MANVYIGSDYTITNVQSCNTASDANIWYQVEVKYAEGYVSPDLDFDGNPVTFPDSNSFMYCTTMNDVKFPKGLGKVDFISNVKSELDTYADVMAVTTQIRNTDWETEE